MHTEGVKQAGNLNSAEAAQFSWKQPNATRLLVFSCNKDASAAHKQAQKTRNTFKKKCNKL